MNYAIIRIADIGFLPEWSTTMFLSNIQIIRIEPVESGISKKTGNPWERHTAQCVLHTPDGVAYSVGRLVIPRDLVGKVSVGTFSAGFTLAVPTYGDSKGDIVAQLVSLTPRK